MRLKFKHGPLDLFHPICRCGLDIETTCHYLQMQLKYHFPWTPFRESTNIFWIFTTLPLPNVFLYSDNSLYFWLTCLYYTKKILLDKIYDELLFVCSKFVGRNVYRAIFLWCIIMESIQVNYYWYFLLQNLNCLNIFLKCRNISQTRTSFLISTPGKDNSLQAFKTIFFE